jgi:hypothetical protein
MLAVLLLIFSAAVYLIQIMMFNRGGETAFYLLQDLAFVPVQVLLVMLIIDKLLQNKEKKLLLNKLNMMIGVFFNEIGTGLILLFIETEKNKSTIRNLMAIENSWDARRFGSSKRSLNGFVPEVALNPDILRKMKSYLLDKRDSMLRLLENPNLLEHDKFTDLVWAVFHLTDELHHRSSLDNLTIADVQHLAGDVVRAYKLVMVEWLEYMKHLKTSYPYLFSIALRTNPFNPEARIEVMS